MPVPGKLFLVGDPKQSIYRFRRADVALYEAIKTRLVGQGASLLYLTRSFRSAPAIQAAVNAAFAPVMTGNAAGTQARYVPLQPHREDLPGQPALVALPVPRPYSDWGKVTDYAVKHSLPDAVGAFVDWLVHHSGWRVTERDGREPVAIDARHVCLLFKRFQSFGDDLTRAYVRALEARRVPHVLVGRALLLRSRGGAGGQERAPGHRVAGRRAGALRHPARAVLRARRRRPARLPRRGGGDVRRPRIAAPAARARGGAGGRRRRRGRR